MSREPLQLVEIDIDVCSLTYGVGACTATGSAGSECYNTYRTCQVTPRFDRVTKTLTFSKNQRTGITDRTVWPALKSVSTSPTRVNLGRTDEKLGSLGKRARVTVNLQDFAWHDAEVDPYVATRSYDSLEQGTFFGKLRSRSPYYAGRGLRVLNGYVGDDPADMVTRNYIVTEWLGPDSSGNVKIVAQDPLRLTDREFAVAPRPSTGTLGSNISASQAAPFSVNVNPPFIGQLGEYPQTGFAQIGEEVMQYAIELDNVGESFRILTRGEGGTPITAHQIGDAFQLVLSYFNARPETVLEELLRDYAGLPQSMLPKSAWAAELAAQLPDLRVTRFIGQPTPVIDLLKELADLSLVVYWRERAQEVGLLAGVPTDTPTAINDDEHILEGTVQVSDLEDKRLSRVYLWHGVMDYSEALDSKDNYRSVVVAVDTSAEGELEYDQSRSLEILQPWLGQSGNNDIAEEIALRILSRWRDTPQRVEFTVDAKDLDAIEIGELLEISTRVIQGADGSSIPTKAQSVEVEEIDPGHRVRVMCETIVDGGSPGPAPTELQVTTTPAVITATIGNGTDLPIGQACFADVSGGSTPYTYSWTRTSGSTDIEIRSGGTSSIVRFQSTGTDVERSATFQVTVTDAALDTVTDTVTLTITHEQTELSVMVTPGSISASVGNGTDIAIGSATAAGMGGVPPYTYSWARTSGDTGVTIASGGTSATVNLQSTGTDETNLAVITCTVTDANSDTATASVSVAAAHGGGGGEFE